MIDVIIVGAGPAGLLAAGRAAELGANVLLLEKMKSEGRKLLITGSGRCNITNNLTVSEFITHVYPNGKFLRTAFSNFYSDDLLNLLKKYGVETTLEKGWRYFPASNKASDVLNALKKWLADLKVETKCNQRVEKLIVENNKIVGLIVNGEKLLANNVILATGGKSYPATGSTGDGYELAKAVGHTIENVHPALVSFETFGNKAQQLQGLNLNDVKAIVWSNGKKMGEATGEMIFTHFGLSGPIILALSRIAVKELQQKNKVEISIDLNPEFDEISLDKKLQESINEHGKKKIGNWLRFLFQASMVELVINELKLDSEKECNQLSSKERKQIRNMMKDLRFEIKKDRSFSEAIITAGGVSLNEISSKTMQSKIVEGLFFAGEMIDLDAETGGFNLQLAFSTGWLAGNSCAKN